jgi:X-X-X-Leu-X-X-Gly heptad repeat protein
MYIINVLRKLDTKMNQLNDKLNQLYNKFSLANEIKAAKLIKEIANHKSRDTKDK